MSGPLIQESALFKLLYPDELSRQVLNGFINFVYVTVYMSESLSADMAAIALLQDHLLKDNG